MWIYDLIERKNTKGVFPVYCFHITTEEAYEKHIKTSGFLAPNPEGKDSKVYGVKTAKELSFPKWVSKHYLFLLLADRKHISGWVKSKEFHRLLDYRKNEKIVVLEVKLHKNDRVWLLEGDFVHKFSLTNCKDDNEFQELRKKLFTERVNSRIPLEHYEHNYKIAEVIVSHKIPISRTRVLLRKQL